MTAAIITMIVALALLVWVFLGVRVLYLRSRQPVSLVFLAIYLLTTLLVASYFILTDPGVSPWRLSAVEIRWFRFAIGLGVTASILIVLDNLLLKGYLVQQRGLYLPGPLRLAIHAAVLAIVVLLLLRTVLHINIVALVAVPTVLTAVIGFALKDTLARLFEGITLGRLMHIGDWVSLVGKEGRVANITLGYVTLQTRAGDYVMVPNNVVAQKEIINYSKPTREHVCCVTVEAAFADAPAKVIAVCQQAAAAVPGVLANPPAVRAGLGLPRLGYRVPRVLHPRRLRRALCDRGQRVFLYLVRLPPRRYRDPLSGAGNAEPAARARDPGAAPGGHPRRSCAYRFSGRIVAGRA